MCDAGAKGLPTLLGCPGALLDAFELQMFIKKNILDIRIDSILVLTLNQQSQFMGKLYG